MTKQEIKKIILENKEILKKYKVKSLAVFGSCARNEQRKRSDIDFLVEFSEPIFDNYISLLLDLKKIFHRKVDLVSIKALRERIKPYILRDAEWLKCGT